ncbi:hypothetical protein [Mesorhizobium sp.]|uniref:hypothetical protein n=1 Tax=Mesorhizobium sp. TaxID=1871066 RepID=UPI000FE8C7A0|nr:hypothetical protein [Mesorhizobium sp.]RWB67567.1 MAG: hypothetical protein EOQ49_24930 [Mesorhizobium sp.]
MNAITKPSRDAEVYMTEDYFAMKRHMEDAIAIYGNGYDENRDSALAAIMLGRAAYWTTSSYSAARTVDLPLPLHRGVSIRDALEEAFPTWRAGERPAALDTLVPLNRKAAIALSGAYASFGIFVDEEILEMRRYRDCRRKAMAR